MRTPSSYYDVLRSLASHGILRARDAEAAGVARAYLGRLRDRGELEQIGRGLYRLPGAATTEHHSLAEVAKRSPRAQICLLSALQFHALTTEVPPAVWLMIDSRARAPVSTTPRLEIVRASGAALTHGVELHQIEGVQVRITSPAKTVADCFRFRRHVGLDVAIAALRDYVARSRRRDARRSDYTIDALFAASRACRVAALMRPYIEALV